jgi:DNA-binding MarR family transcriptional regulator
MPEPRAPVFRRLLAWQINSASDALRRGSALRLKREHDISLVEWRTIALIGAMQPVRLRDVAAESAADKAQISRIVSGLVRRGVVERQAYAGDARSAYLQLTPEGIALASKLAAIADDRDQALRSAVDETALAVMLDTLAAVTAKALALSQEEERLAPPPAEPGAEPPVEEPAS